MPIALHCLMRSESPSSTLSNKNPDCIYTKSVFVQNNYAKTNKKLIKGALFHEILYRVL